MDDATLLEHCLERLAAGETLETCLADYPQLEPALRAALYLHTMAELSPTPDLQAVEAQLQSQFAALRAQPPLQSSTAPESWPLHSVLALMATVLRRLGYRGVLTAPLLQLSLAVVVVTLTLLLGLGSVAAFRALNGAQEPTPTIAPPTTTLPAATAPPQPQPSARPSATATVVPSPQPAAPSNTALPLPSASTATALPLPSATTIPTAPPSDQGGQPPRDGCGQDDGRGSDQENCNRNREERPGRPGQPGRPGRP